MQSILQFRRFKTLVAAQLERAREEGANAGDPERRRAPSFGSTTAVVPPPEEKSSRQFAPIHTQAAHDRDPEKAEKATKEPDTFPASSTDSPTSSEKIGDELDRRESVESVETVDYVQTERALDEDDGARSQISHNRPISRLTTIKSTQTVGTKLGLSLTGIDVRDRTTNEGGDVSRQVFVVGYQGENDQMNPHNWSFWRRIGATVTIAGIAFVVGVASSIDSGAISEAAADFHVSEVAESLATGVFLAGFGVGALVAGPFSETVGRNPVYIVTLTLYMIFIMASALAPNFAAQVVFRFIAGFFGSTPLTCAGGSLADMWNGLERVFMFPVFANAGFMGPVLGPVIAGFIAESNAVTWRWTEWTTLIMSGVVLFFLVFFQPETYPGTLLKWKAQHMRDLTGDDRFRAPMEIREETLAHRLLHALYRPFIMTAQEPIILLIALYMTIIYIILFGFLDGYSFIFGDIHHTSQGVTGLCFLGIAVGLCISSATVPFIYRFAKKEQARIRAESSNPTANLPPEFRLWYAMAGGAFAVPISLFWMGWTDDSHISIWSPLAASVLFGYGILTIFISSYTYIIDSYEKYAASALASITLIRYLAAGGAAVWGIPFYENLGVHWATTLLGCLGAVMVPVPYVFYFYGRRIRQRSRYAQTPPELVGAT